MASPPQYNQAAWDTLVRQKQRFARAASDRELADSLRQLRDSGWIDFLRDRPVLCLAAGGGRQGPLYALAGADVTVADISEAQLQLDREVARRHRVRLRTVHASMDDLSMLRTGEFELVVQPVSTCYLPDLRRAYQEVARVTAGGARYLSQHKQPTSLQATTRTSTGGYLLEEPYYRAGPLPAVTDSLHREPGTLEYLHRWEQLLGSMCRAGFLIEDVTEPRHDRPDAPPDSFGHRSCYAPPYVRVQARRRPTTQSDPSLWLPR